MVNLFGDDCVGVINIVYFWVVFFEDFNYVVCIGGNDVDY